MARHADIRARMNFRTRCRPSSRSALAPGRTHDRCAILCAGVPSGCFLPSRADLPSLARLPLVSRGVFIAGDIAGGDHRPQGRTHSIGEETMTAAESAELAQRYDPRDVQEKWQGAPTEVEPSRPRQVATD